MRTAVAVAHRYPMSVDTNTGGELTDIDAFAHRLCGEWGAAFSTRESKWAARATVALDCMGGFAEYCGALTLTMPTADSVYAAAQARHDQSVQVSLMASGRNGHPATAVFPLSLWYEGGRLVDAATFAQRIEVLESGWSKPLVGVLHVLLADERIPHLSGGLTIIVATQLPWESGVMASATVVTMGAVCKCLDLDIPPVEMALLCQRCQNTVLGVPCGPSAAACALLGEPQSLLQLLCQPLELVGRLLVPEGVVLMGVDCGARHPAAARKFREARVAAFMGRRIIARHLDGRTPASAWGGYLARLSVSDYVDTFRDRLPTKMKGKDFLTNYGDSGDPLSSIDEATVYKIRSRTEHHIYENTRVHQFAERIARARRSGTRDPLIEMGELMFASHWSYGQRCGLGSIETDKLVNCLRRRGPRLGVFGARICGAGAGGTVVVLASDTQVAHDAVGEAVAEYAQATGCTTRLLACSTDAASAYGVRQLA